MVGKDKISGNVSVTVSHSRLRALRIISQIGHDLHIDWLGICFYLFWNGYYNYEENLNPGSNPLVYLS